MSQAYVFIIVCKPIFFYFPHDPMSLLDPLPSLLEAFETALHQGGFTSFVKNCDQE